RVCDCVAPTRLWPSWTTFLMERTFRLPGWRGASALAVCGVYWWSLRGVLHTHGSSRCGFPGRHRFRVALLKSDMEPVPQCCTRISTDFGHGDFPCCFRRGVREFPFPNPHAF